MNAISEKMNTRHRVWAKLPEPFCFYRLVLNSDHLHFGLWPDAAPDFDLEKAQERMFDLLLSFFPDPPADVLDVGCGLGLSASLLAKKGYRVTAIAPSSELIAYARQAYADSGVDFQIAGFLDDSNTGFALSTYDMILFQESFQYLHPLDTAVRRARKLLREKGKIIIGDEVCRDRSIQSQTAVHHQKDMMVMLAEQGFRILSRREIQNQVIHTCNRIIHEFSMHFDAICQAVNTESVGDRLAFFLNGWKNQLAWYTQGKLGYEIIVCQKDDVFIRGYRKNDEHRILPLFRKIFNNPRTIDHWNWKYRDNPYGRYHIIAAFSESGELAAHFAGYPVPFYSANTHTNIQSIQGGDTMTNPAFRSSGRGSTSVLSRIANCFYDKFCSGGVPFIYGFNTGTIRKFGERFLQYEYLPQVPFHVREASTVSTDLFGRIFQRLKGVKVQQVHAAGLEFDRFFQKVSRHYGLLVKRDGQYLRWRYLSCPDRVHRLVVVSRWGRMAGWGVFSLRGETLVWGDALCEPDNVQDMAFLLNHVVEGIRRESPVTRIEAWFFSITDEPNMMAPCFKFFSRDFSIDYFRKNLYYSMGDSDLF
ncbi:MAG: class I SAM-dependent methyltransferase [Deltaproteobacteria bacterium]|nr:class I SAM-dependent methyltransferase [Deltaproteobacteria bacterium]